MRRFAALLAVALFASSAGAFDPAEKYAKSEIQGFTVLVHPEVEKHPEDAKAAFTELESQLKKVCAAVPEKPLAAFKKVRLWVEWEAKKNGFVHGGKREAYAAKNAAEYFAELSEAYFGKNDFFPFTRDELAKHDPTGFEMLKKAWGDPAK